MPARLLLLAALLVALPACHTAHANGVGVVDASRGDYLRLTKTDVRVAVENQVAVVTTTQHFRNDLDRSVHVTYAFPMPEGASATALRWRTDGLWQRAVFVAAPQDTTLPGGVTYVDLRLGEYLGATPLYFDVEADLAPDAVLTVELTYVQLLPYEAGRVAFTYPNDYRLIQTGPLDEQHFRFTLRSLRRITTLSLDSHTPGTVTNEGLAAEVARSSYEDPAERDYEVHYELSPDDLGLFGFSTLLPDSVVADDGGRGFFVFVAEPDPSDHAAVIEKVFTLVVDRSGSMYGDKMRQAREAARFVVEHLNEGDRFNIVDFSSDVASFAPAHVEYDSDTRAAALRYIDAMQATGTTNISGAFDRAIPQFAAAGTGTANLVVFFTDGLPTAGIVNPDRILEHVDALVRQHETDVVVFTFGVGPDVDRQLLTRLATQHGGLASFLGIEELEAGLSTFYLQIRNPVLLDTRVTFSPPVVTSRFPDPLPNLYQGQQMIVAGRYDEPAPLQVTLSGEAFGRPVSYTYTMSLADSVAQPYLFLPKVWAKHKIEHLLVRYHSLPEGSNEARAVRDEVVAVSLAYGVMSPFTSFQTGGPEDPGEDPGDDPGDDPGSGDPGGSTGVEEEPGGVPASAPFALLGAAPNPFSDRTTLRLQVDAPWHGLALVRVYDVLGRLVRVLAVPVAGPGTYEVDWDGRDASGAPLPSGTYLYVVALEAAVLTGHVVLVR